jgi:hypothetical protein
MALTANLGQDFIFTATMSAGAAATYTMANPVGVVQARTGDKTFRVTQVEVQWVGLDGGTAASTVQVAHVDAATVTNMFAAAIQALPPGISPMASLTNSTYVTTAVPDNSVATSTNFTGIQQIRIVTSDADTQVKVRIFCSVGEKALTVVTT